MKIPKKHEMKLTMVIMVFVMTLIITFASVSINYGWVEGFGARWMKAWALSFVLAVPIVLAIVPLIKKQIARFVE